MSPSLPLGPGLIARSVRVADEDAVLLRSIVEAYDGLACYFGDGSGVVTLLSPTERVSELDSLLSDLRAEGISLTAVF